MDDNNNTLTACAVEDDCTASVAASTISKLRSSSIWRNTKSDFGRYQNTQSNSEQNALFSNAVQQSITLLDHLSCWFTTISDPISYKDSLEFENPEESPPDNFQTGAVASPNKTCQVTRSTRRSFVANQKTSRRINNATNNIKQLNSRIR